MDRNDLILTAQKLTQVSEEHASEFSSKIEHLVDLMNQKMAARADILDMVGVNNLEMMKDNHASHARFLESIFASIHPKFWLILYCGFSGHTAHETLHRLIGRHN